MQDLRESLALVEANQNARRGKLEGLEARLKVLQEAQAQAAGEPGDGVTLEGAVATVYEMLRVPRGLEEAIAAVLGDQLEAFVFEHQADAVAAIESLVREDGPRARGDPAGHDEAGLPAERDEGEGRARRGGEPREVPAEVREADQHAARAASIVVQDVDDGGAAAAAAASGRSSRRTASSSTSRASSAGGRPQATQVVHAGLRARPGVDPQGDRAHPARDRRDRARGRRAARDGCGSRRRGARRDDRARRTP